MAAPTIFDRQAIPLVTPEPDEATAIIAMLDAFAATPARISPHLMLHDRDDGLVFYAVRLWCSARRIGVEERTAHNDTDTWTVLNAEFDGRSLSVFGPSQPLVAAPALSVVPPAETWRPSDADDRLLELE